MSDHRRGNPCPFRLLALPILLAWLPAAVHAEIPTHSVLLPVVEVPLRVPLGQSEIMRLPRQSGTVLMADPQIAGVQIASPQVIMILGKSIGKTSIAIFDQTGELMVEKIVQVAFDLQPARSSLQSSPELSKLTLTRRNRSVEIRGSVASAELVHQALELILSALPEGVSIVNRISVLGPQQVNLEVQIAEIRRSVSESWVSTGDCMGCRHPAAWLPPRSLPRSEHTISTTTFRCLGRSPQTRGPGSRQFLTFGGGSVRSACVP